MFADILKAPPSGLWPRCIRGKDKNSINPAAFSQQFIILTEESINVKKNFLNILSVSKFVEGEI